MPLQLYQDNDGRGRAVNQHLRLEYISDTERNDGRTEPLDGSLCATGGLIRERAEGIEQGWLLIFRDDLPREGTGAESRAAGGCDGAEHGNERQVGIYYAVESGLHDVENLMVAKTGVFLRPADLSRWPALHFSCFIRQA